MYNVYVYTYYIYIHSLYKPLALPRSAIFETRAICHGEASGVARQATV